MFRHAYGGFAPHFAFAYATHGHSRHLGRGYCSWNSGPLLGVRRPVRHLAYRLDLDDAQVRELAEILDRLKTARAQADVDWRRSTADLAGALESGDFDAARADSAFDQRVRSAEQLRGETLECLKRLHRLLDPDQRRELAYLMRSGSVAF